MEKIREEFEAWWERYYGGSPLSTWDVVRCDDGYSDERIDEDWQVWQASRAAIEITLPDGLSSREALAAGKTCEYAGGMNIGIAQCEANIRDAGLKVRFE